VFAGGHIALAEGDQFVWYLHTDHYSHKIVGYHLSQNLKAQGSLIALNKAYPDNVIEQQIPVPDNPVSAVTVIKELKEAQLKITALEMFIEIAGKELGVDLQKKFGTKLSKK